MRDVVNNLRVKIVYNCRNETEKLLPPGCSITWVYFESQENWGRAATR